MRRACAVTWHQRSGTRAGTRGSVVRFAAQPRHRTAPAPRIHPAGFPRTISDPDSPSERRVTATTASIRPIYIKINILTSYPQGAVQLTGFLIESKKLLFCTPVTD